MAAMSFSPFRVYRQAAKGGVPAPADEGADAEDKENTADATYKPSPAPQGRNHRRNRVC